MITKKTKRASIAFLTAAFATASAVALGTGVANSAAAQTDTATWSNYEIVKDGDAFKGVNIKDGTEGALSVLIPTGSAVYAADTANGWTGGFAVTTYDIEDFSADSYSGMLFQIDRTHASENTGPRFFVETSDGTWYRFNSGSNRNDTFIKADGTATTWQNTKSRYTFQSNMKGTLYVPFSVLLSCADSTVSLPSGATITKFHYALDTRTNGFYGDTRGTAIGTIAAVNADTSAVTKVFGLEDLTYTMDASVTTADVNLADMSKGTKVYAKHTIAGTYVVDQDGAEGVAKINALPKYSRTNITSNVVNCVDTDGKTLQEAGTFTSTYNATTGKFAYELTAPSISGYTYKSADKGLTGELDGKGEVTLTYEQLEAPKLTAKFVDEQGNTIADDELVNTTYDFDTLTCSYDMSAPAMFGYEYVSADKALSGTFTEDTVITLTYKRKAMSEDKYDVVLDDLGGFVGVNIKNAMSGSLVINVKATDSSTGYSLTTIDITDTKPSQSTGILVQAKRLTGEGNAQVRMFLEDQNGTLYRLFTANADPDSVSDNVIVKPDGSVGSVTNEKGNSRHQFSVNHDGTMFIPWTNIFNIDGSAIPADAVFTKFHFGRELRYDTTVNKSIALGTIAAVKAQDGDVVVEELVNLASLTYTNDATVTTADVNLADKTKGATVYMTRWVTGTHAAGDASKLETVLSLVDWTRMPPQITLAYVDEAGETIKASTTAEAEYAAGGSTYDITPPSLVGYEFVSADKELKGVSDQDFTITLTYKKMIYTITLEFVDENGNVIKEAREVNGTFQEYVEITPDEIEGYTYKEATANLKVTIMGSKTIRLTYTKNETGCNSSVAAMSGVALVAAAAVVCVLKKKKSDD